MKGNTRFEKRQLVHIYQNTLNGFLLFYSVRDRIVFFTILNLVAKKYGIHIVGVCLMPDHFHLLIELVSLEIQSAFIAEVTQRYSRLRNEWYGDRGDLFSHSYGYALKQGGKKMRTAAAYLYNNPVEKALCGKAEEYPWNFLAYAKTSYPFSNPIKLRYASRSVRRAVEYVKYAHQAGIPMTYQSLDSMTTKMRPEEVKMLTDFIIQTYSTIDYDLIIGLYKGYQEMLQAFASNTGSEYDIKETFTKGSDKAYTLCANRLLRSGKWKDIREILSLPEYRRRLIGEGLSLKPDISSRQAAKFLRYKEIPE